jgi:hypothetical protein
MSRSQHAEIPDEEALPVADQCRFGAAAGDADNARLVFELAPAGGDLTESVLCGFN